MSHVRTCSEQGDWQDPMSRSDASPTLPLRQPHHQPMVPSRPRSQKWTHTVTRKRTLTARSSSRPHFATPSPTLSTRLEKTERKKERTTYISSPNPTHPSSSSCNLDLHGLSSSLLPLLHDLLNLVVNVHVRHLRPLFRTATSNHRACRKSVSISLSEGAREGKGRCWTDSNESLYES